MHVTCESIGINIHYYRDINETVHVTKASIEIKMKYYRDINDTVIHKVR